MVVIGGGPVGMFTTFYAGLRDMKVMVVDAQDELGGQLVSLYPEKIIYDVGGYPAISAYELAQRLAEQMKTFGPDVRINESVDWIRQTEDKLWEVETSSGYKARTKTVTIAVGIGKLAPTRLGS